MTYVFNPPSRRVAVPVDRPHGLLSRLRIDQGLTVLKTGTSYRTVENPAEEQVRAADVVYIGGHTYEIADTEATALTSAGYGIYITTV